MPRKAPTSATSAAALQIGSAPSQVRLATSALGQAGSRDALTQLTAAMAELKAFAIQPLLNRAVAALQAEDHQTGGEWAIKALEMDERNGFGWYLLAIARERAGDFASSVAAYESALRLLPDHAEVANDLGRLAYRMGMRTQAEKLFRHFLTRYPDHPEGANNLACAIRDQDRPDEAVEILRPAILKHPHTAMLWNTMGTVIAEQGDFPNAEVFFREALRLQDDFPKARYNAGNARLALGDPVGALAACEQALAGVVPADERQMMRLARSTILMALGRVGEGWDEYEARLDPQFNDVTHFAVDRPRWEPGADLAGRSLLVIAEQGLGDEVLFANTLPDVLDRLGPDGRLTLAVEPRLMALFTRSFPQARIDRHATYNVDGRTVRVVPAVPDLAAIDLWTPMGSLLREFRRNVDAFPQSGSYLRADPARVAHWHQALETAPAGAKVGLLWKSAVSNDARHRFFSPFAAWAPVLAQPGVTFVNLQYGDCSEELAWVKRELGVQVWTPPGIDLKQDLDDVAALCCALDLVVGFSNATLNIAGACGVPMFLMSTPGAWPRLGTERYPWYPQTRLFLPPGFGDWDPVMAEVAQALGEFSARPER
ncbi:tetratricopeptide repeat protein [Phenylobacterium sp.]|uniref:tetratricopeptide repeat-containing glycosyltransferase family protein n=1 Tax=Phenylobacterium sp. TaxID=1871053 RepID=UPI003983D281